MICNCTIIYNYNYSRLFHSDFYQRLPLSDPSANDPWYTLAKCLRFNEKVRAIELNCEESKRGKDFSPFSNF